MRRLILSIILCICPAFVLAQQAATLVADQVTVDPSGILTASGNVEIFYDGSHLSASQVIYSQSADQLTIQGPLIIRDKDGTVLTADTASLDPKLRTGVLISARLVLNKQLQLAASEIQQLPDNTTQMRQVGATSCTVCDGRPPLWEIRARSVVHKKEEQQLYFDDAVLRIRGVPIIWVPYLRIPDPTLTRATGLLRPIFRSSDLFGFGVKLPYFWRISDSRDITFTPYISPVTTTLEMRYRQAFSKGNVIIESAVSNDNLIRNKLRGFLRVSGKFEMPYDYRLTFCGTSVTDRSYLLQYAYGKDENRLKSNLRLERVDTRFLSWAEIAYFTDLSTIDPIESRPPLIFDIGFEKRNAYENIGTLTYGLSSEAHFRFNHISPASDRDTVRVGAFAKLNSRKVFNNGLVLECIIDTRLNYYNYNDDMAYNNGLRGSSSASLILRYPLIKNTNSATHILEPMFISGWSKSFGKPIANEDSTRTEFDEANIHSLIRFAGDDILPNGQQMAAGIYWHRVGTNSNWSSRLYAGRVFTLGKPFGSFSSGLSGSQSDWLIASQIQLGNGLQIDGRALLDENYSTVKTEVATKWDLTNWDLTANYIWLPADPDENRSDAVSEWRLSANYQVNDQWRIGLSGRYDIITDQAAQAGLRLRWQNECIGVELSASRRYVTSTTVETTTDYDLSIDMLGFGTSTKGAAPRSVCTNK